jgi:3-isopropylmalate dehydrogenase
VLDSGWRTADIAGDIEAVRASGKLVGTEEMGELVVKALGVL